MHGTAVLRFFATLGPSNVGLPVDPWLELDLGSGWIARARIDNVNERPVIAELRVAPKGELPADGLHAHDLAAIGRLEALLANINVEREIRTTFSASPEEPVRIAGPDPEPLEATLWPWLRERPPRPSPSSSGAMYYATAASLYEQAVERRPEAPSTQMAEWLNDYEDQGVLSRLRPSGRRGPSLPWTKQKARDLVRLARLRGYLDGNCITDKARRVLEAADVAAVFLAADRWALPIGEVKSHDQR